MPERAAARPSTAGTTRAENRKRTTLNAAPRPPAPAATRVGVVPVLRRMLSRAVSRPSKAAESAPKQNRRRSSAPSKPSWDMRMGGWRERMVRPIAWAKRAGSVALRGVMVLAIAAGAVAVGRLIEAHVRRSEAFATKVLELQGNVRLDRDAVLSSAGLSIGKNVFAVSPEEAEAALLKNPWIASAQVTRRLPDSYALVVEERQAVALLSLDEPYLVAGDASVFKRWQPGDPEDLPMITGVEPGNFAGDRMYRTALLVNAVALLHDYRDAGLWRRAPIQEIHADNDDGLTLYIGEDATTVRLHRPPFRQKLTRLRRVLDQLAAKHVEPAYVYLDNVRREDRVTVRLR